MRIIVTGAGIAGLFAAYKLGKAGNEVVVFDENNIENLGYDWHDFVWNDFFDKLGLDGADKEINFFRKNNMSFEIFNFDTIVRLNQNKESREYAVSRRDLSRFLYEKAVRYAKIHFNTRVDSLINDGDLIKGVKAGGMDYFADLVIDNTGVFSMLRKHLPQSTGIEQEPDKNDIMFVYRATFSQNNVFVEDDTKCYLRHLNQDGISWVNLEPDGKVDILIGRIGGLTLDNAEKILIKLKEVNPVIGERLSGGDRINAIPIRHPAVKMFCKGYVMLGDSAFMTVPLLGSGICSSIAAADILCSILNSCDVSEENLYRYQQRFYSEVGAVFFEIDTLKSFLLKFDTSKLLVLLKENIITVQDLTDIYNAKPLRFTFFIMLTKSIKGLKHPILLVKMSGLLLKIHKIKRIVGKMPKIFKPEKLALWSKRVKAFYK